MNSFIAIYNDGCYLTKDTIEEVFSLPGNYHIFSIGDTTLNYSLNINQTDGVIYFNYQKIATVFKMKHLELVDIERIRNSSTSPSYRFSIHDDQTDSLIKINGRSSIFEISLADIVNKMIVASQFPTWETYDAVTKIEEYKSEIKLLKEEVQRLKKENNELRMKA